MFSGVEIEMILFAKSEKPESVLPFSNSHSGCENWKSDVTKLKLENWKTIFHHFILESQTDIDIAIQKMEKQLLWINLQHP